jgi:prepilin-type N-terminal cleavage/methylation domain-containing protein
MKHRPGVTLVEVLVALFIMAIGMLALLVLFPLGALSMGQALKDDRCTTAAALAENHAIAQDLRHDYFMNPTTSTQGWAAQLFANAVPAGSQGPSSPIYVDPYGVLSGLGTVGLPNPSGSPGIVRVNPCFAVNFPGRAATTPLSQQETDRWFSLLDDITFLANATPDPSGGMALQRAGNFTWAYLLRRPQAQQDAPVQLFVAVYYKRAVGSLSPEFTYQAAGAAGTTNVTLAWGGSPQPNVRRGGWVLDTTLNSTTGVVQGDFYRVVNYTNVGNSTTLELQTPLRSNANLITVMDDLVEVFDKGTSWQP